MLSHANNSTFFFGGESTSFAGAGSGGFAFATSQPRDHFNRSAYPVMVLENEDILVTKNTNPEMLGNC